MVARVLEDLRGDPRGPGPGSADHRRGGNPGGLITAGQKLIRMLTTREVLRPSPLAFRSTVQTQRLGSWPEFEPWRFSLDLQEVTGDDFSQTLPITTYGDDLLPLSGEGRPHHRRPLLQHHRFVRRRFRRQPGRPHRRHGRADRRGGANVWTWDVLQFIVSRLSAGLRSASRADSASTSRCGGRSARASWRVSPSRAWGSAPT